MNKIIFIIFVFSSCSGNTINRDKLQIVVEFASSTKIDIANGVYTTKYMAKPSFEVPFILTSDEKNRITNEYFSMKLGKAKKIRLGDDCGSSPKLYTIINVMEENFSQQIYFSNCENYGSDADVAMRVKDFIALVKDIVESKNNIKSAPESDILYY